MADTEVSTRPTSGLFPLLRIPRRSRYSPSKSQNASKKDEKSVHGWSIKVSKFPGDKPFGYAVMCAEATTDCLAQPVKLLQSKFNFQEPGLVLSILGELADDMSLQWTLNAIQDGLALTVRTTGAWTISNGIDHMLNRLVSDAHRTRRSDAVPAIGVLPWDASLLRRSENTPYDKLTHHKQYLERNHSMFLFFEEDTPQSKKTQPCCRFEQFLLQRAKTDFRPLPLVKLLFGGNLDHLKMVKQATDDSIPVLVLQGSGGAADVLGEIMEQTDSAYDDGDSTEEESESQDRNSAISRMAHLSKNIVADCGNKPDLLRRIDLTDLVTASSVQIAILQTAIRGPRLNPKEKISSFLAWEHDLSSLQTLSQVLLEDVNMEALIDSKPKILGQMLRNELLTRHFLTKILTFLKRGHIKALYQDCRETLYTDLHNAPWKVTFQHIEELLKGIYSPLESISFYFRRSGGILSSEEKIVHLFLWSVLSNRESVSRVIWEEAPEPLLAALVAHKILTRQAAKFTKSKLSFEQHARMFEDIAVELLDRYHRTSVEQTRAVLSKKSQAWGKVSSFRMAIDSQKVLSHESFEPVVNEVWMGDLAPSNSRLKVFLFILFQMRYFLTYKRAKGCQQVCKSSATAPLIKYYRFMMSYLAFLAIYTINLLLGMGGPIDWLDWLVALWIVAALVEEIHQILRFRGLSLRTMLIFVPYSLFVIGFVLHAVYKDVEFPIGTLFLTSALAFFYVNGLRFFLAFRALGLKVVMIRDMIAAFGYNNLQLVSGTCYLNLVEVPAINIHMYDMTIFMIIMITIMLGYGIAVEVTLFPDASIAEHGAKNLLRRPVWQLFGELLLDEIEGSPDCVDNRTQAEIEHVPVCPTKFGQKIAPAMTAIYMFITNVLLLNLLIAIFSSTYRKVQRSAVRYLNYESYRLAIEFALRSYFPPPLSLIENVYSVVKCCLSCKCPSLEEIAQEIHSQAVEEGMESRKSREDVKWEENIQDQYLESIAQREFKPGGESLDDKLAGPLPSGFQGPYPGTLPRPSSFYSDARKMSLISLADLPSPPDELASFRKLFIKQMQVLNERLQKIETHLQMTPRSSVKTHEETESKIKYTTNTTSTELHRHVDTFRRGTGPTGNGSVIEYIDDPVSPISDC